ncbi:DUF6344 domain-containing protein [Streptomyces yaizuensis]|uniref:DUF6344 domain-containing protein n=1 Tax=Streptomyces yaizuensis TaxID=2989713 RepID=A0ABQ5P265_9ACTN|nr:DUF6344 domain-containing protein [Streptomyces sp. YSPA8]GLF96694.1 DUF6344 domain-containing protein [Streptomyces sp. YSPA8]
MASVTVRNLWTALVTALVALLTRMGLSNVLTTREAAAPAAPGLPPVPTAAGPAPAADAALPDPDPGAEPVVAGPATAHRTARRTHPRTTVRASAARRTVPASRRPAGRPAADRPEGRPTARTARATRTTRTAPVRDSVPVAVPVPTRARTSAKTSVRSAARSAARPKVPAQSRWSPGARARSLPPTIKQRIRAEAHNTSPSVRKLPSLDPLSLDSGSVTVVSRSIRPGSAERTADRAWLTTAA